MLYQIYNAWEDLGTDLTYSAYKNMPKEVTGTTQMGKAKRDSPLTYIFSFGNH